MNKFLLYDESVHNDLLLLDSLHNNIVKYDVLQDSSAIEILNNFDFHYIEYLGFLFHYQGSNLVPFFNETKHNKNRPKYSSFSDIFVNFLKTIRNIRGVSFVVDILSCDFNSETFKKDVQELEQELDIVIRYSVDQKGNSPNGNWIMESHNIDVKDLYFTEKINLWDGILTSEITISTIVDQNKNIFSVTTSGDYTIYTLLQDISWNSTDLSAVNASSDFIRLDASNVIFDGSNHTITIPYYQGIAYMGLFIPSVRTDTSVNNPVIIRNLQINSFKNFRGGGIIRDTPLNSRFVFRIENCSYHQIEGVFGSFGSAGGICGSNTGSYGGFCVIDNCYSKGDITNIGSGGICSSDAAWEGNCIIENCYSVGNIISGSSGICGSFAGGGLNNNSFPNIVIKNCYSEGDIINSTGGGICGINAGYENGNCVIQNCYSKGDINSANAGGICGSEAGESGSCKIENCYSEGHINGIYSGGICGSLPGKNLDAICVIKNCYSKGDISGIEAGGICGSYGGDNNGFCIIDNCYSTGNIVNNRSGGICGSYVGDRGKCIIKNCYSIGDISGNESGGICGVGAGFSGICEVYNCYSNGNIIGEEAGGICGSEAGESGNCKVENCYSIGNMFGIITGGICGSKAGFSGSCIIKNCYSNGDINGDEAGGICGNNAGTKNGICVIQNCYSTGGINNIGSGGICGGGPGRGNVNDNGKCIIQNCYSIGDISGNEAGGITGRNTAFNPNSLCIIQNCYSIGDISGNNAGGITGYATTSNDTTSICIIQNCYSKNVTGNITNPRIYSSFGLQTNGNFNITNINTGQIENLIDASSISLNDGSANTIILDNSYGIVRIGTSNSQYYSEVRNNNNDGINGYISTSGNFPRLQAFQRVPWNNTNYLSHDSSGVYIRDLSQLITQSNIETNDTVILTKQNIQNNYGLLTTKKITKDNIDTILQNKLQTVERKNITEYFLLDNYDIIDISSEYLKSTSLLIDSIINIKLELTIDNITNLIEYDVDNNTLIIDNNSYAYTENPQTTFILSNVSVSFLIVGQGSLLLQQVNDISGVIINADKNKVDISFNDYTDFDISLVILGGDLSGLTVNNINNKGFTIIDLSSNTTYIGDFKVSDGIVETDTVDISFTTLLSDISNVIVKPNINIVDISFDEYTDFDISLVILGGDLSGLTVNNINNKGFTIFDLSSNTTYIGDFKVSDGIQETDTVDISFTTLPIDISGVIINANKNKVDISFDEYTDFDISLVILGGDLSGLTVNNINNKGFTIIDLSSNTTYIGDFKVSDGIVETDTVDISFTTLPSDISNTIVKPNINTVDISFDEYTDFDISLVILGGHLSGLTVNNINNKGFTIIDLSSNTTYIGDFKVSDGIVETDTVDISFTTLPSEISNINIIPNLNSVIVTFNKYMDFNITKIILTGEISSLFINNIRNDSFRINGLVPGKTYSGGFRVSNGILETTIKTIQFTTLNIPINKKFINTKDNSLVSLYNNLVKNTSVGSNFKPKFNNLSSSEYNRLRMLRTFSKS
jgi:aspartate-semialdehyde dehydrogenase